MKNFKMLVIETGMMVIKTEEEVNQILKNRNLVVIDKDKTVVNLDMIRNGMNYFVFENDDLAKYCDDELDEEGLGETIKFEISLD